MPSQNKKIAKSIAAFANSHGGTIFYGVNAERAANLPADISGIRLDNGLLDRVRNVGTTNIRPVPYFRTAFIPSCENQSVGVLVVDVPESQETPHFVDGVIYVREGERSDPQSERDHYLAERLFERRRDSKSQVTADLHGMGEGAPQCPRDCYQAFFLATPSSPREDLLPVFERDFWSFLRGQAGSFMGGNVSAVQAGFRSESAESNSGTQLTIYRSGSLSAFQWGIPDGRYIPGTWLIEKFFGGGIDLIAAIFDHSSVEYLGGLTMHVGVKGTRRHRFAFNMECPVSEPALGQCPEAVLMLRRAFRVEQLKSDRDSILQGFKSEILRACGMIVLGPG